MRMASHPRGQPLLVLALLLGGWTAMRAALWESPFAEAVMSLPETIFAEAMPTREKAQRAGLPEEAASVRTEGLSGWSVIVAPVSLPEIAAPVVAFEPAGSWGWRDELVPFASKPGGAGLAAGHNLVMLAGLASVPLPPELAAYLAPKGASVASVPYQPMSTFLQGVSGKRWSGDAWVLLRRDEARALAAGEGSYGASQAGAVLRYSIAPKSGFKPAAFVRVNHALGGGRDGEVALGLSARPVPGLPLRAAAEMRVTQTAIGTQARPAAYVVSELPPFELPLGFTGEAYAQAGYVGGADASAFADGQLRIERDLARLGPAEIKAGGGLWGGAQKGAARLDIGPGATLAFDAGGASSRVSLDWRFRVAGEAQPASGPALTVTAGF